MVNDTETKNFQFIFHRLSVHTAFKYCSGLRKCLKGEYQNNEEQFIVRNTLPVIYGV